MLNVLETPIPKCDPPKSLSDCWTDPLKNWDSCMKKIKVLLENRFLKFNAIQILTALKFDLQIFSQIRHR